MIRISVSLPAYIFPSVNDLKRCISKIYQEQFTLQLIQHNEIFLSQFETEKVSTACDYITN